MHFQGTRRPGLVPRAIRTVAVSPEMGSHAASPKSRPHPRNATPTMPPTPSGPRASLACSGWRPPAGGRASRTGIRLSTLPKGSMVAAAPSKSICTTRKATAPGALVGPRLQRQFPPPRRPLKLRRCMASHSCGPTPTLSPRPPTTRSPAATWTATCFSRLPGPSRWKPGSRPPRTSRCTPSASPTATRSTPRRPGSSRGARGQSTCGRSRRPSPNRPSRRSRRTAAKCSRCRGRGCSSLTPQRSPAGSCGAGGSWSATGAHCCSMTPLI
mmetsp:Transcript_28913/g.49275  ORF Transcript_28913/g.49275 Transcript_28913/m.49275 type:complete len:270 (+) Transcript_28913:642-1451(+)